VRPVALVYRLSPDTHWPLAIPVRPVALVYRLSPDTHWPLAIPVRPVAHHNCLVAPATLVRLEIRPLGILAVLVRLVRLEIRPLGILAVLVRLVAPLPLTRHLDIPLRLAYLAVPMRLGFQ
jgi:hypothetical protein